MTIEQKARELRRKYHNPRWCQGFDEGVAHAIKAVRKCLSGEEQLIDGGWIYPLPKFSQPNLNELLGEIRAFKQVVNGKPRRRITSGK